MAPPPSLERPREKRSECSPGSIPIKVDRLAFWLAGYEPSKKQYLIDGFTSVFRVGFQGTTLSTVPQNLPTALAQPELIDEYIAAEIRSQRVRGPFAHPPFVCYQCSPLGIVPKKDAGKFRVIHHLSYPEGQSVNDQISKEHSSVCYHSVADAVSMITSVCKAGFMSKTDVESAFRIIPIHLEDPHLFIFQWGGQFFVDTVLAMGCASSCQIFGALSTAIAWIAYYKIGIPTVHYLDDFLLGSPSQQVGLADLQSFLDMCDDIGLPISMKRLSHRIRSWCFWVWKLIPSMKSSASPGKKSLFVLMKSKGCWHARRPP